MGSCSPSHRSPQEACLVPSEQLWLGIAASVSAGAEGGAETDSIIGGARVKGGWGGGWAGEAQEQNRPATTAKDRATDNKGERGRRGGERAEAQEEKGGAQ